MGEPVQEKKIVKIQNGRIDQIRSADKTDYERSDILNLSGSTVLPCLVDSHVHLTMSGTTDRKLRTHILGAGYDEAEKVIGNHLMQHQAHGVLTVRDGGDKNAHVLRYQLENDRAFESHVALKVSGRAWHQKRRYGGLIGRSPAENQTLGSALERSSEKIDQIKIVNSGLNSLADFGRETSPQFNISEMKDACRQAHGLGRKVMVHANGKVPVSIAIESGCDSIEHGFFMGKENLEKMAEKNILWVPTACTMKAFSEQPDGPGISSDVAKRNLDHQLENMALARTLGAPIAVGTDAGSPGVHHGRSVSEEMALLTEAGYTIEETVQCATSLGAGLLDLKETGMLAPGVPATFISVKGRPVNLLDNLKQIEHLFLKGSRMDYLVAGFNEKERR